MEYILVILFYLARPILTINIDYTIFGVNFFEFATILFTIVLGLIFLINLVSKKRASLSTVELWIIAFIVWCTVITLVYSDLSVFKSYIKWILPPFTFLILKRAIHSRETYVKCLGWLITGFFAPIFLSAFITIQGLGLDEVVYQTGLPRYRGVYSGIHSMGHSAGICIMLVVIYITLGRIYKTQLPIKLNRMKYMALIMLVCVAIYCLIHTHVRTVYVGLTAFFLVFLFYYSKKGLIIFSTMGIVAVIVFASIMSTIFFDIVNPEYAGKNYEKVGSGRPWIWSNNLNIWLDAPIDNKIAGIGIGNWMGNRIPSPDDKVKQIFNSHNDFLEVFLETGIVGFIIIVGLYWSIGLAIARQKGREKYVFAAFFLAVVVMNMLSVSYIGRFPMAQLFYMIIVYLELTPLKLPDSAKSSQLPPDSSRILSRVRI